MTHGASSPPARTAHGTRARAGARRPEPHDKINNDDNTDNTSSNTDNTSSNNNSSSNSNSKSSNDSDDHDGTANDHNAYY